jgi:hypothetical protein
VHQNIKNREQKQTKRAKRTTNMSLKMTPTKPYTATIKSVSNVDAVPLVMSLKKKDMNVACRMAVHAKAPVYFGGKDYDL